MATSKKPTPKKTSVAKKTGAKKTAVKKATPVKKVAKKTVAKKTVKKAVAKRPAVKKTAKKKTAAKKTLTKKPAKTVAKKAVKKAVAKKAVKKVAKKSVAKKAAKKKTTAKKVTRKATASRKPAAAKASAFAATEADTDILTPLMEIEAKKFEIDSRRPGSATPPAAPRELDEAFHETHISLLVRDPEWIFIYWEIDDETRERFSIQRERADKHLVLRWYDVTDMADFDGTNSHHVMDVDISGSVSSWYQHMPEPGRSWCAEMGNLTADGAFHVVCRSNFVRTPAGRVREPQGEETWLRVASETSEQGVYRTPAGTAPTRDEIGGVAEEGEATPVAGARGIRSQGRQQETEPARPDTATSKPGRAAASPKIRHALDETLSSADLISSMGQDSSGFAEELRRRRDEDD
jgi:hypothetical protein